MKPILCHRIDAKMHQNEMVRSIMEGLKPQIARYISILDNEFLDKLKTNIRK